MAGVRKSPEPNGKFKGWFVDYRGKQQHRIGTRSRRETLHMMQRLEDYHRQIRLGYRPLPDDATLPHNTRSLAETMEEYVAWGKAQGGRGGRPWSFEHQRNRLRHLAWWQEQLNLEALDDVQEILPKVEAGIRALQAQGRSGKTLVNYVEALQAFCAWCMQRHYLPANPLQRLAAIDTTPRIQRRSMTIDEIRRVLAVGAPHEQLLLETAFLTGLRVRELRSLQIHHLDRRNEGLILDAAWTKNRKPGFQPLPTSLVRRLTRFAQEETVVTLYQ